MILRKRQKSVSHPELPFFGFDIYRVLERATSRISPATDSPLTLWIINQPTLACIETSSKPCIFLHSILNHHQTPELVMDFILTHELLHLVVPPREIGGIVKWHPPEFLEAERRAFPELELAWNWLTSALCPCLKPDPKKEATLVKTSWRRFVRAERPSIEKVADRLKPRKTQVPLI